MKLEELKVILENHKKWLENKDGGKRADLREADLMYADLRYADLREADLMYADLTGAKLNWVNFEEVRNLDVIAVQINTSIQNRQIKYIPKLDKVFVGCFSGTLEELKEQVKITQENNDKIKNRYFKAIKFI